MLLVREKRQACERNGKKINKENFLAVYGMAHMQTTTPKIVLAAFQITGYITPAL
jgi:hypothetical protein